MIEAMGAHAIKEMSVAKPAKEVALLKALNTTSTIITDGKKPLNLLTTARAMIRGPSSSASGGSDGGEMKAMSDAYWAMADAMDADEDDDDDDDDDDDEE